MEGESERLAGFAPDERRINARMMEVYAGMLAYQDDQIGRVLAELDRLGGPDAVANVGFGWAWATDAPFQLFKQYASHLGGTRNGLVVSWPDRIKARGLRSQFTHVTDVMPTVLELAGIAQPDLVNGVPQQRIDGVSFAYSFAAPRAPERHDTQYFEMLGNRAIYHRGWLASTTPVNLPWHRGESGALPTGYKWELYDLRSDFSQSRDLAARAPARLAELQALFKEEAARNQVFPLDDRLNLARFAAAAEGHAAPRDKYTYWGPVSIPAPSAAPLLGRAFRITAKIELPDAASGAVVALGSQFGGWSFYLDHGRPVAVMAASQFPGDQSRVVAGRNLAVGPVVLEFDFRYDGGVNGGGEMAIRADGNEIGRGWIAQTISKLPELTDTLDIGFDADPPVTRDYPVGGQFSGKIAKVEIAVGKTGVAGRAP